MLCYTYGFIHVEGNLHYMDEAYLIMVYDHHKEFFNMMYTNYFEKFWV